ncbi:hypothetical protein Q5H80_18740 [Vibrio sp. SNU_ST1]|uniref:imm11 family protein n=1 Tax=Vibrio sp. SNU_ST1 TaxID=3064001 RepID=UPI00272CD453|nr:DUF1629 domain-containing protein [Vibrio sp. SNU_ST1]WKY59614.1 hypothetical protein Q5H80_18740 [Vibrio sp. SNU_ST1]
MKYHLMFGRFEKGEGSFSEQEPLQLNCYQTKFKLFTHKPVVTVDDFYEERGVSDFLKIALGFLASNTVQEIFETKGFKGIQFLPVEVHNEGKKLSYSFMNYVASYDLLDPNASKAKRFKDIYGGYGRVSDVFIDKSKFTKEKIMHDCFTLSNYKLACFVSDNVKSALEAAGVTGIEFIPMEFA